MRFLSAWLPVLVFFCLLEGTSVMVSDAADVRDLFETHVFRRGSHALPYRLLRPQDYDPQRRYPLVIFFHGAGERGTDNERQLIHGMGEFASPRVRSEYPCFVVAPQCPADAQWVETPWTAESHRMPEQPSVPLELSLHLLDELQQRYSIDPDRWYVTGLSMGGFGAWDVLQRRPQQFAAAVIICGGGDAAFAPALAKIPLWIFHGDQDTAVQPQRSRNMVAALQQAGGEPKYTEYINTGHNSWTPTYQNPATYAWLFAQRRRIP